MSTEAAAKPSLATRLSKLPWRLLGLVLLVVVLLNVDFKLVLEQFAQLGPAALLAAAGANVIMLIGRCWRWIAIAHAVGFKPPAIDLIASCNKSILLGNLTPGRAGELQRALLVATQRPWTMGASIGLVLFDLAVDFSASLALGLGGLLNLFLPAPWGMAAWIGLVALQFLAVCCVGRIIGLVARLVPMIRRVPGFADLLPELEKGMRGSAALNTALATALFFGGYVLMIACITGGIEPHVDAATTAASVGLAGLAAALPLSYFGLGTREAALIWFLGQQGVPHSVAAAFSLHFPLGYLIGIVVSLVVGASLRLLRGKRTG